MKCLLSDNHVPKLSFNNKMRKFCFKTCFLYPHWVWTMWNTKKLLNLNKGNAPYNYIQKLVDYHLLYLHNFQVNTQLQQLIQRSFIQLKCCHLNLCNILKIEFTVLNLFYLKKTQETCINEKIIQIFTVIYTALVTKYTLKWFLSPLPYFEAFHILCETLERGLGAGPIGAEAAGAVRWAPPPLAGFSQRNQHQVWRSLPGLMVAPGPRTWC